MSWLLDLKMSYTYIFITVKSNVQARLILQSPATVSLLSLPASPQVNLRGVLPPFDLQCAHVCFPPLPTGTFTPLSCLVLVLSRSTLLGL